MSEFRVYWTESNFKYITSIGSKAAYHGSREFVKLGVSKSDRLWVMTLKNNQLYLVSQIVVERVEKDRKIVEKALGAREVIDMPEYALAASPPFPVRRIPVTDLSRELGLKFNIKGRIEPQQFRSIRQLTPENAVLLERKWALAD